MRFQLTDDQRALRDGVRQFLARRFDGEALRAAVTAAGSGGAGLGGVGTDGTGLGGVGLDRALWRELGAAGFFALRLPEEAGGVGLGLPEAALVFEEAGRALLPGPLIATHLAAGLVPGAATGEVVVAAVDGGLVEWWAEADVVRGEPAERAGPEGGVPDGAVPEGGVPEGGVPDEAVPDGAVPEGGVPDGAVPEGGVPDGAVPEGGVPDGAVPEGGVPDGAVRERAVPVRSVDPLTPLHRVAGTSGRPSGSASSGPAPDPVAVLLTAAEQLGTAARACELAVQHARTREQFGQPIGAFQAVKHLCADMLVRTEVARAAVYAAAVTAGPADIAAARLLADEAALRNTRDCLQVHGGMGFTWESEVHLHLKRAWVRAQRGGGITESEEALAAELVA